MNVPPLFAFTDCKDQNALTRLQARLTVLFPNSQIHGVGIMTDVEASGCILDTLDALRISKKPAIIIGNLAPRSDKSHKNGAPFYVGHVGSTHIIATKTCFTLLAKIGLLSSIYETDVETVCMKFVPKNEAKRIANSQFRSFEYVPLLAKWVFQKKKIPGKQEKIVSTTENTVWWVDNFGNCKTTITEDELRKYIHANAVTLTLNDKSITLPFYQKLADVPKGERAIIIGSSGYKDIRFAEIVKQGGSASDELKITSGAKIG